MTSSRRLRGLYITIAEEEKKKIDSTLHLPSLLSLIYPEDPCSFPRHFLGFAQKKGLTFFISVLESGCQKPRQRQWKDPAVRWQTARYPPYAPRGIGPTAARTVLRSNTGRRALGLELRASGGACGEQQSRGLTLVSMSGSGWRLEEYIFAL